MCCSSSNLSIISNLTNNGLLNSPMKIYKNDDGSDDGGSDDDLPLLVMKSDENDNDTNTSTV